MPLNDDAHCNGKPEWGGPLRCSPARKRRTSCSQLAARLCAW
jgi:hypothetical protein